jgi:hypothetical protein
MRTTFLPLLLSVGTVVAGLVLLRDSSADRYDARMRLELPAFDMVHQVARPFGTLTFRLSYEGRNRWKEVLIGATAAGDVDLGRCQEVRAGQVIHYTSGHTVISNASRDGTQIPWRWFSTPERIIGRVQARTGASLEVEETSTQTIMVVSRPDTVERYVFDRQTGILLDYRETYQGAVVIEQTATSLVVLDSGRTIR